MTQHSSHHRAPALLSTITTLAVALWLGSLAHLLLSVASLFRHFPRLQSPVAVEGAPVLFHVTERYHLALAGVAIVGVFLWRRAACTTALRWVSWLLVVAALLGVMQLAIVSPRMRAATLAEDRATFAKLHGASNVQYLAQTVLVLSAMLLLPTAMRAHATRLEGVTP